jgi:UDP-N-acetylglucosamine 1-carboxyvinyltransferase
VDKIRIVGGKRLSGRVEIGGAKNAVLPAMATCLLTDEPIRLDNVPDVWDVGTMRRLLSELGAAVTKHHTSRLELQVSSLRSFEAPYELVKTMRASVLVLGPLLARHGRARVSLPGGCAIGARPINLHLTALEKLGAKVKLEHGFVEAETDRLQGTEVYFDNVTVTGTENILMAACLARGVTLLQNCAQEPEVVDLAQMLNRMGARIEGAGTRTLRIEGVERLSGIEHSVIPDRIEAGTYLAAGALMGESVELLNCRPEHMTAVIDKLEEMGARIETGETSIRVNRADLLRPANVRTLPHPGFPTDMQAQVMVLLTQADGTSLVSETIFENRFMHVSELNRMGANIELDGHTAVVKGPTPLSGARVMATDLRASACLMLAGMIADGQTLVDRVYHLDRGYEHIEQKLAGLGAEIERLKKGSGVKS